MKILVAHNYYCQPGGEDRVFKAETELLRQEGHAVLEYTDSNERTKTMRPWQVAADCFWSARTHRRIAAFVRKEKPEIAHFHNIFPLISPAAYDACLKNGVKVVQSLHNSRLICPAARLFRDGRYCEDCLTAPFAWPGIRWGCYRHSRVQTAMVALMTRWHRWRRTWQTQVDAYIVFTDFYKQQCVKWGLPEEKIFIKPHFLPADPLARGVPAEKIFLFVGRLSADKGVRTLLQAWQGGMDDFSLEIIGNGDDFDHLQAILNREKMLTARLLGQQSPEEVYRRMKQASAVVVPSEVTESFGMVALEALACGVPVIASDLGGLGEMIRGTGAGLLFPAGDAQCLRERLVWASRNPDRMELMGKTGRRLFEARYARQSNANILTDIYRQVLFP
ncbi:MAG: glycosyltransferase family 4 protein [Candidatus Omnitrophica bacterium]|nr:glycosyltransferase family 4 protein [Candidatus Omnitrophota bacterium]